MKKRPCNVLLALGSNLQPQSRVPQALELLHERFEVVKVSPAYRSAPVGAREAQPDFVNLAVRVRTDCPPRSLREACRRIEDACGRRRTSDRYAARTMDIDIVLIDDLSLDFDTWRLPDPDLHTRAFVLVPGAAAWPDAMHPALGRTLAALRDALSDAALEDLDELPSGWEASP